MTGLPEIQVAKPLPPFPPVEQPGPPPAQPAAALPPPPPPPCMCAPVGLLAPPLEPLPPLLALSLDELHAEPPPLKFLLTIYLIPDLGS